MANNEKQRRTSQAQSHSNRHKKKGKHKVLIGCIAAAAVLVVVFLAGCLLLHDNGTIVQNLYVAGIHLGGMTKEEAAVALTGNVHIFDEENMNIELYTRSFPLYTTSYDPSSAALVDIFGKPMEVTPTEAEEPTENDTPVETPTDVPLDENGDPLTLVETICLTPTDAKVGLDIDAAVDAAYQYGRGKSIFSRTPKALEERYDLDVSDFITVDENYIRTVLEEYAADTGTVLSQPTVNAVTGENARLEITLGTKQRSIDVDNLYDAILVAYTAGQFRLQYAYVEEFPEPFDLDEAYASFCTAPVNAVCDEETFEVTAGKTGYGFRMEDAIALLDAASEGDTVILTMGEVEPLYTTETLKEQLFKDVLGSCDTPHTRLAGRTKNLELACAAINGTILKPGDTFSFNQIVGKRTTEKGYQMANAYVGGDTTPVIGGGICQVASTLYYCTVMSELEVIERAEHQYVPDYIEWGIDATIYWGQHDYRFRNNTSYPIRIDAWVEGGYVHARFVGTETRDYTIKLTHTVLSKTAFDEVTLDISPDMPNYEKYKDYKEGDIVVYPYTGYKVESYMYKYDANGNEISCTFIAKSNYDKRDRVIAHIVETESSESSEPTEPPTEPTEPPTEAPTDPPTEAPTEAPTDPTDPPEE